MSLRYGLIAKKKTIEVNDRTGLSPNKVEAIDLLTKTMPDDIDYSNKVTLTTVTREYIGRPDLVSLALYGTDEYADIICKINGISNPFELNEGTELICPVASFVKDISNSVSSGVSDDLVDDLDEDTIVKANASISHKKTYQEERTPNEATISDHNYTVTEDNTIVWY